jgi:DnaA family protein
MVSPPRQLSLDVSLVDDATFNNFFTTPASANHQVLDVLRSQLSILDETSVFIWGNIGVGCSHLLQAACHAAQDASMTAVYLPLRELKDYSPADLLNGLELQDLICIDDVQLVFGAEDWERQLFHLYNRVKDQGGRLLFASNEGPLSDAIQLADLRSRLNWGLVFQVVVLSDEEKVAALILRATKRGMDMSFDVGQFILSRYSRDLTRLFQLLDRLDKASLVEQRRLTIPFVKDVLAQSL